MARRGPRIGRVEPVVRRSERLVPTPDDWYPAIFRNECHPVDATHDVPDPPDAWGPSAMGAFERGHSPDKYLAGAYANVAVMRWLLPDAAGRWMVRVCVWGGDDFGLEQDFFLPSEEEAEDTYFRWIGWMNGLAYVAQAELRRLGFHDA